ncbi:hypothetical protein DF047_13880 [Burkholderia cenocepacia]|nr:hypothetical protein DF047_13880 [Burkholderia cenocepacia]RQV53763.1 hypothetical protein DF020_25135 [Burkholderia cenocepacia]
MSLPDANPRLVRGLSRGHARVACRAGGRRRPSAFVRYSNLDSISERWADHRVAHSALSRRVASGGIASSNGKPT